MDFSPRDMQRNGMRPAGAPQAPNPAGGPAPSTTGSSSTESKNPVHKVRGNRVLTVLAVLLLTALAVGGALAAHKFLNPSEASMVDKKRYQAVFLSNGQVYFGKVAGLNNRYIDLQDIYYLNVANQSVQPSQQASQQNVSLVKLGCELHSPQDRMVIYRDQVTFWENLKDEGQVATAIKQWKDQNPDGQKCNKPAAQQPAQQPAPQQQPSTPTPAPTPTPRPTNRTNPDDNNAPTTP